MIKTSVEKTLDEISQKWFYTEPLLFSVLTSHSVLKNENLSIPMRSGRMCIEYSETQLENFSSTQIEEYLKVEALRILFLHPYSRKPFNCQNSILMMASDAVINQLYKISVPLKGVEYLKRTVGPFATFPDMSFEEWYRYILDLVKNSRGGDSVGFTLVDVNSFDEGSELWEENEEAQKNMESQIQKAQADEGWGSVGGNAQRELKESVDFSFDYRRALNRFRQNIVSANRKLTRMRPSRRYGFKAMGSRYERKANILIAVDSSGSIQEESFSHFYRAIKNIFFLGIIEKIDLIFFDVNLKNTRAISFTKNVNLSEIKGKGGTDFQCAIDFFEEHDCDYSGLIIFTDGEGNPPKIRTSKNILWILDTRMAYEKNRLWIENVCSCSATYLPF